MKNILQCRFCKTELKYSFCDLGKMPLSNAYLFPSDLHKKENYYPLHVFVCEKCMLVQLPEHESPENIFSDYAYFSSYSDSWLEHSEKYVEGITKKRNLNINSFVVEIASNDGYLLQFFKKKKVPCLGIEPAENVAKVAIAKNIPTITQFFGKACASNLVEKGPKADLIIANNVLAHVPDINDFVSGMKILLKRSGMITIEVPYLLELIKNKQFDTIYHEHFSYFSLIALDQIFKAHGLQIVDVEKLFSHGGSLRIFVKHLSQENARSERFQKLLEEEKLNKLNQLEKYFLFSSSIDQIKYDLLDFLILHKKGKKKVVGYGAPAKGNTLLNYCGIKKDLLLFTVDRNPAKQNKFLPGSHIPIKSVDEIEKIKPDYILILPWNLKREIMDQLSYIRKWGGKFVVPIPQLTVE